MHYDALETRDPAAREADLFARLPAVLAAALKAPGWKQLLGDVDPASVTSRAALAKLPVLRKHLLPGLQKERPPFAGFSSADLTHYGRFFSSPGPIFEPETRSPDPWRAARALVAAGFRKDDVVLNCFSYHLTPGGFIMDQGARAAGCIVIPAGPGNTEQQLEVVEHLKPVGYTGTPDFLKILLDKGAEAGRDVSSFRKALVSGAAFPPSLRDEFIRRGIQGYQAYATADVGVIAYETEAREGLVLNEDMILEIVRPGTGDPVPDGEVGEVVVTLVDPHHPVIRIALGDLTAVLPGVSPCGRTNVRIKGWMGRADQTAKVKGMFVRPEQVADIAKRHVEVVRLRVVVSRENEQDVMTVRAEATDCSDALVSGLADSVRAVTKLSARIELVAPGALPNDGKVIADERPIG